jgi:hypothetical protein
MPPLAPEFLSLVQFPWPAALTVQKGARFQAGTAKHLRVSRAELQSVKNPRKSPNSCAVLGMGLLVLVSSQNKPLKVFLVPVESRAASRLNAHCGREPVQCRSDVATHKDWMSISWSSPHCTINHSPFYVSRGCDSVRGPHQRPTLPILVLRCT